MTVKVSVSGAQMTAVGALALSASLGVTADCTAVGYNAAGVSGALPAVFPAGASLVATMPRLIMRAA